MSGEAWFGKKELGSSIVGQLEDQQGQPGCQWGKGRVGTTRVGRGLRWRCHWAIVPSSPYLILLSLCLNPQIKKKI